MANPRGCFGDGKSQKRVSDVVIIVILHLVCTQTLSNDTFFVRGQAPATAAAPAWIGTSWQCDGSTLGDVVVSIPASPLPPLPSGGRRRVSIRVANCVFNSLSIDLAGASDGNTMVLLTMARTTVATAFSVSGLTSSAAASAANKQESDLQLDVTESTLSTFLIRNVTISAASNSSIVVRSSKISLQMRFEQCELAAGVRAGEPPRRQLVVLLDSLRFPMSVSTLFSRGRLVFDAVQWSNGAILIANALQIVPRSDAPAIAFYAASIGPSVQLSFLDCLFTCENRNLDINWCGDFLQASGGKGIWFDDASSSSLTAPLDSASAESATQGDTELGSMVEIINLRAALSTKNVLAVRVPVSIKTSMRLDYGGFDFRGSISIGYAGNFSVYQSTVLGRMDFSRVDLLDLRNCRVFALGVNGGGGRSLSSWSIPSPMHPSYTWALSSVTIDQDVTLSSLVIPPRSAISFKALSVRFSTLVGNSFGRLALNDTVFSEGSAFVLQDSLIAPRVEASCVALTGVRFGSGASFAVERNRCTCQEPALGVNYCGDHTALFGNGITILDTSLMATTITTTANASPAPTILGGRSSFPFRFVNNSFFLADAVFGTVAFRLLQPAPPTKTTVPWLVAFGEDQTVSGEVQVETCHTFAATGSKFLRHLHFFNCFQLFFTRVKIASLAISGMTMRWPLLDEDGATTSLSSPQAAGRSALLAIENSVVSRTMLVENISFELTSLLVLRKTLFPAYIVDPGVARLHVRDVSSTDDATVIVEDCAFVPSWGTKHAALFFQNVRVQGNSSHVLTRVDVSCQRPDLSVNYCGDHVSYSGSAIVYDNTSRTGDGGLVVVRNFSSSLFRTNLVAWSSPPALGVDMQLISVGASGIFLLSNGTFFAQRWTMKGDLVRFFGDVSRIAVQDSEVVRLVIDETSPRLTTVNVSRVVITKYMTIQNTVIPTNAGWFVVGCRFHGIYSLPDVEPRPRLWIVNVTHALGAILAVTDSLLFPSTGYAGIGFTNVSVSGRAFPDTHVAFVTSEGAVGASHILHRNTVTCDRRDLGWICQYVSAQGRGILYDGALSTTKNGAFVSAVNNSFILSQPSLEAWSSPASIVARISWNNNVVFGNIVVRSGSVESWESTFSGAQFLVSTPTLKISKSLFQSDVLIDQALFTSSSGTSYWERNVFQGSFLVDRCRFRWKSILTLRENQWRYTTTRLEEPYGRLQFWRSHFENGSRLWLEGNAIVPEVPYPGLWFNDTTVRPRAALIVLRNVITCSAWELGIRDCLDGIKTMTSGLTFTRSYVNTSEGNSSSSSATNSTATARVPSSAVEGTVYLLNNSFHLRKEYVALEVPPFIAKAMVSFDATNVEGEVRLSTSLFALLAQGTTFQSDVSLGSWPTLQEMDYIPSVVTFNNGNSSVVPVRDFRAGLLARFKGCAFRKYVRITGSADVDGLINPSRMSNRSILAFDSSSFAIAIILSNIALTEGSSILFFADTVPATSITFAPSSARLRVSRLSAADGSLFLMYRCSVVPPTAGSYAVAFEALRLSNASACLVASSDISCQRGDLGISACNNAEWVKGGGLLFDPDCTVADRGSTVAVLNLTAILFVASSTVAQPGLWADAGVRIEVVLVNTLWVASINVSGARSVDLTGVTIVNGDVWVESVPRFVAFSLVVESLIIHQPSLISVPSTNSSPTTRQLGGDGDSDDVFVIVSMRKGSVNNRIYLSNISLDAASFFYFSEVDFPFTFRMLPERIVVSNVSFMNRNAEQVTMMIRPSRLIFRKITVVPGAVSGMALGVQGQSAPSSETPSAVACVLESKISCDGMPSSSACNNLGNMVGGRGIVVDGSILTSSSAEVAPHVLIAKNWVSLYQARPAIVVSGGVPVTISDNLPASLAVPPIGGNVFGNSTAASQALWRECEAGVDVGETEIRARTRFRIEPELLCQDTLERLRRELPPRLLLDDLVDDHPVSPSRSLTLTRKTSTRSLTFAVQPMANSTSGAEPLASTSRETQRDKRDTSQVASPLVSSIAQFPSGTVFNVAVSSVKNESSLLLVSSLSKDGLFSRSNVTTTTLATLSPLAVSERSARLTVAATASSAAATVTVLGAGLLFGSAIGPRLSALPTTAIIANRRARCLLVDAAESDAAEPAPLSYVAVFTPPWQGATSLAGAALSTVAACAGAQVLFTLSLGSPFRRSEQGVERGSEAGQQPKSPHAATVALALSAVDAATTGYFLPGVASAGVFLLFSSPSPGGVVVVGNTCVGLVATLLVVFRLCVLAIGGVLMAGFSQRSSSSSAASGNTPPSRQHSPPETTLIPPDDWCSIKAWIGGIDKSRGFLPASGGVNDGKEYRHVDELPKSQTRRWLAVAAWRFWQGGLNRGALAKHRAHGVIEIGASCAIAVVVMLPKLSCRAIGALSISIGVAHLLYLVILRPHASRSDLIFGILNAALLTAYNGVAWLWNDDDRGGGAGSDDRAFELLGYAMIASAYVQALIQAALWFARKRRGEPRQETYISPPSSSSSKNEEGGDSSGFFLTVPTELTDGSSRERNRLDDHLLSVPVSEDADMTKRSTVVTAAAHSSGLAKISQSVGDVQSALLPSREKRTTKKLYEADESRTADGGAVEDAESVMNPLSLLL